MKTSGPSLDVAKDLDLDALVFLVMMEAARSQQETVRDLMLDQKRRNALKDAYRTLQRQVREDNARVKRVMREEYEHKLATGEIAETTTFESYETSRPVARYENHVDEETCTVSFTPSELVEPWDVPMSLRPAPPDSQAQTESELGADAAQGDTVDDSEPVQQSAPVSNSPALSDIQARYGLTPSMDAALQELYAACGHQAAGKSYEQFLREVVKLQQSDAPNATVATKNARAAATFVQKMSAEPAGVGGPERARVKECIAAYEAFVRGRHLQDAGFPTAGSETAASLERFQALAKGLSAEAQAMLRTEILTRAEAASTALNQLKELKSWVDENSPPHTLIVRLGASGELEVYGPYDTGNDNDTDGSLRWQPLSTYDYASVGVTKPPMRTMSAEALEAASVLRALVPFNQPDVSGREIRLDQIIAAQESYAAGLTADLDEWLPAASATNPRIDPKRLSFLKGAFDAQAKAFESMVRADGSIDIGQAALLTQDGHGSHPVAWLVAAGLLDPTVLGQAVVGGNDIHGIGRTFGLGKRQTDILEKLWRNSATGSKLSFERFLTEAGLAKTATPPSLATVVNNAKKIEALAKNELDARDFVDADGVHRGNLTPAERTQVTRQTKQYSDILSHATLLPDGTLALDLPMGALDGDAFADVASALVDAGLVTSKEQVHCGREAYHQHLFGAAGLTKAQQAIVLTLYYTTLFPRDSTKSTLDQFIEQMGLRRETPLTLDTVRENYRALKDYATRWVRDNPTLAGQLDAKKRAELTLVPAMLFDIANEAKPAVGGGVDATSLHSGTPELRAAFAKQMAAALRPKASLVLGATKNAAPMVTIGAASLAPAGGAGPAAQPFAQSGSPTQSEPPAATENDAPSSVSRRLVGTAGDLDQELETLSSRMDSLSELNELEGIRLQNALGKLSKFQEMLSNIMKKNAETMQSIVQNLK